MASAHPKRIETGRPLGTTSADPVVAAAFGRAVVKLRRAAGIPQEAVALAASIGRANLSAIENGRSSPNFVTVVKIAAALGCNLSVLVTEFEKAHKTASKGTSGIELAPRSTR